MTRFVLIAEGQSAPLASQVTAQWLAAVAAACTVQLNRDVSPYWGGQYSVRAGSGPTDLQPSEIAFGLLDALPDAPGAVAYHDVMGNAAPYALLALTQCKTLDDVSTGVSHEICETAGDPDVNEWCEAGDGFEYARELCDAVESGYYLIDGVRVSDFVLPAFFQTQAPGPYCYTQAIGSSPSVAPIAPFVTAAGGYQVRRSVGTGETDVWGALRPLRAARAQHPASRVYRRGARV